ncbi:uncharacterized protein LOC124943362 [Impatiens glandulifera]|uniref:uncharacterized protein LOC124943362 n=1 Tax=Impatiens glandulifera TaxID=253017 RepID=UPI001FB152A7|nr:uncharacterized protein LOC124943362 [Impatiens glandulifera]
MCRSNVLILRRPLHRWRNLTQLRLILAIVAHYGWEIHHLNIKSAFLNGDIKEEVYVTQLEGFIIKNNEHKEQVVYTRNHREKVLIVGVYVNDLIMTRSSIKGVEEFKK